MLQFQAKQVSQTLMVLASMLLSITAMAADMTAKEIMQEQQRRHNVAQEFTNEKMVLHSASGKVKERQMATYSLTPEGSGSKTLIKFLEPSSIANVGLLTWEQPESEDDDQWLHLPASKKIKRISGGGKANPFMGTDFSFEDMRAESIDTHDYKILGEEELGGQLCWVIEALPATPKEKKTSGYSKRVFWVRQDVFFTVQTEFYNRKPQLIKRSHYRNLEELHNGAWRSNEVTMENLKRKTKTVSTTQQRDLKTPIAESLFETQSLKRPLAIN